MYLMSLLQRKQRSVFCITSKPNIHHLGLEEDGPFTFLCHTVRSSAAFSVAPKSSSKSHWTGGISRNAATPLTKEGIQFYTRFPQHWSYQKEIGSALLEVLNISPQQGEMPGSLQKVSVPPVFRKLLSDTDHLVNYHPALSSPSMCTDWERSSSPNMLPSDFSVFCQRWVTSSVALAVNTQTRSLCLTFTWNSRDLVLLRTQKHTRHPSNQYQL